MNDTKALLPHIKLLLTIDHPGYEECYSFGYECAMAEMAEEENPYKEGSAAFNQWQEGWWAGFYGEEPLFQSAESLDETPAITAVHAANDEAYHHDYRHFIANFLKITGAITATALIGYQIIDMVA